MKKFKGITNFLNKTYDSALELVALTLANSLNKNLRTIIVRQGKDPDYVKPTTKDLIDEVFRSMGWGLPAGFKDRSNVRPTFNFINKKRDFPTTSQSSIERLIEKYNVVSAPDAVEEVQTFPEVVPPVVENVPEVLVHVGFDIGSSVPSVKPKKRATRKRATKKVAK